MIGILLVSHGMFSEALRNSSQMIIGEIEQIDTVCLISEADIDEFENSILQKANKLDMGEGVLVLADLCGGTPYNRVQSLMQRGLITGKLISGMNMPLVINACFERNNVETISELVDFLIEEENNGIEMMKEMKQREIEEDTEGCEED